MAGEKILIIRLSALGDVISVLPHVAAIVDHHREDEIWVMTSPSFAEFFVHHPRLRVAVLDRGARFTAAGTWAMILWTRQQGFETIFDLQGNRTSRLLVRFSGAPRRVGTQPRAVYNLHPDRFFSRHMGQSAFELYNDTLAVAGEPPARITAVIHPAPADLDKVKQWQAAKGLTGRPYVLLHAGSSVAWPSKRWPEEHFCRLAGLLEQAGYRCLWIGSEEDRAVNDRLARQVGTAATGELSPLQLYLTGQGARLAVTNDSGPMHILAAAGLPVYGFFGPTNWRVSHAAGQQDRVLRQDLACSPCFLKNCPPARGHQCLAGLEPAAVFARIKADLELV